MTPLRELLEPYVKDATVPGAVALLARGDDVEVEAVGTVDVEGSAPMARDSLFRIASRGPRSHPAETDCARRGVTPHPVRSVGGAFAGCDVWRRR